MKILIIEDNTDLSDNINNYLTGVGYVCEQAFNREEARMKILFYEYDCILLDITLPDGSGLKLLDDISNSSNKIHSGIIIISAKDSLDDRINGIRLGADDYLVKLFDLSELSVRVFSVIRRRQYNGMNIVQYGNLKIDTLIDLVKDRCNDSGLHIQCRHSTEPFHVSTFGNLRSDISIVGESIPCIVPDKQFGTLPDSSIIQIGNDEESGFHSFTDSLFQPINKHKELAVDGTVTKS